MSHRTFLLFALLLTATSCFCFRQVGAEELDVPTGKIEGPFPWQSEIFPGTTRQYWVYVPSQYRAEQPTCFMVVQDGLRRANDWKLPAILDRLIHEKKIPVQIGIFVDPGIIPIEKGQGQPRFNRSFEYDSLGTRYADFLLKELIPEVSQRWNLSEDPNDRAIAGASSGAICAFNVAWERPDAFRRVFSTIGTYVGLRGADEMATLVRKGEHRPIRVFLQDGIHDLNIYGGDWWMANQSMLSALRYAGYDVRHAWGDGGHDGRHGREVCADALTWLWQDYPQPIRKQEAIKPIIDLLPDDAGWQKIELPHDNATALTSDAKGLLTVAKSGRLLWLDERHQVIRQLPGVEHVADLVYQADGTLLASLPTEHRIVAIQPDQAPFTWVGGAAYSRLCALPDRVYASDPQRGAVHAINRDHSQVILETLQAPTALAVSPDHQFLMVVEPARRHFKSYQIQAAGALSHGQDYGFMHWYNDRDSTDASDAVSDDTGRTYLATNRGIQVFDPLGRCNLILRTPHDKPVVSMAFGGSNYDQLYVVSGGGVWYRALKTTGHRSTASAVIPPAPRL